MAGTYENEVLQMGKGRNVDGWSEEAGKRSGAQGISPY